MGEAKRRTDAIECGSLQACGNCRHWMRLQDGQPRGICRRYPPAVVQVHQAVLTEGPMVQGRPSVNMALPMQSTSVWPETLEGLACGEHEIALRSINLSQLEHLSEPAEGTA